MTTKYVIKRRIRIKQRRIAYLASLCAHLKFSFALFNRMPDPYSCLLIIINRKEIIWLMSMEMSYLTFIRKYRQFHWATIMRNY